MAEESVLEGVTRSLDILENSRTYASPIYLAGDGSFKDTNGKPVDDATVLRSHYILTSAILEALLQLRTVKTKLKILEVITPKQL
jgi:isoaspartyl peptidase/L-asparaginase-like protein (Ntn-hydrolase superfamily)